jgi:hypothetical protein
MKKPSTQHTGIQATHLVWVGLIFILIVTFGQYVDFLNVIQAESYYQIKKYGGIVLIGFGLYWKSRGREDIKFPNWLVAILAGFLVWYSLVQKVTNPALEFWRVLFGLLAGFLVWFVLNGLLEQPTKPWILQKPLLHWVSLTVPVIGTVYYILVWLFPTNEIMRLLTSCAWFFIVPGILLAALYVLRAHTETPGIQLLIMVTAASYILPGLILLLLSVFGIPLNTMVVHVSGALLNIFLALLVWFSASQTKAVAHQ